MVKKILFIGLISVIYCFAYWYLYSQWGLVGAAVLIGVLTLLYFGFYGFIKFNENKMGAILGGLSDQEILSMLRSADEVTKKEVLIYIEKHPVKYRYILDYGRET